MRKLNEMFHIDGEQLVKTSNGQPVPSDEPLFILRGRDRLALSVLSHYIGECKAHGVPDDRIGALIQVEKQFEDFANTKNTKIPGSTHGT
jgi:hypothetical protein